MKTVRKEKQKRQTKILVFFFFFFFGDLHCLPSGERPQQIRAAWCEQQRAVQHGDGEVRGGEVPLPAGHGRAGWTVLRQSDLMRCSGGKSSAESVRPEDVYFNHGNLRW